LTLVAKAYEGASYAMLSIDIIDEVGKLEENSRFI